MKNFPEALLKALKAVGLKKLLPLQETLLPPAFERRDVLATGPAQSGLIDSLALILMVRAQRNTGKIVLGIVPEDEMAEALSLSAIGYLNGSPTPIGTLHSLGDFDEQEKLLDQGLKTWVATPKRLVEHLKIGNISLSNTEFLIIAHLDRLLMDRTQAQFLNEALRFIPRTRQTIAYAEAMNAELTKNLGKILKDPVKVQLPDITVAAAVTVPHAPSKARKPATTRTPPRLIQAKSDVRRPKQAKKNSNSTGASVTG